MINIVKDPISKDANTFLLLHGEDLTDSSKYGHTVTNSGVTISTAQSRFDGSSLHFNGSSHMNIPISVSGDFTIDFWCYIQERLSGKTWVCPVHLTTNGSRGVLAYMVDSITYLCTSSGTVTTNEVIAAGAWHHYAIVRSGTSVKLYIDGTLKLTTSGSFTGTELAIGYDSLSPNDTLLCGYMDEIRVSNVARWAGNFTPPTKPYVETSIEITPGGTISQKGALMRRMMATKPLRLPSIYQAVEYLENTGTQNINSGIVPGGADFIVRMNAKSTASVSVDNWFISIHQTMGTTATYLQVGTWSSKYAIHLNNVTVEGTEAATNNEINFELAVTGNVASLTVNTTHTASNNYFASGAYRNGTIRMYAGKYRTKGMQVVVDGNLVRNLVPCYRKSDNVAGMYDYVSGVFFTNEGSGTFVVGPDV